MTEQEQIDELRSQVKELRESVAHLTAWRESFGNPRQTLEQRAATRHWFDSQQTMD